MATVYARPERNQSVDCFDGRLGEVGGRHTGSTCADLQRSGSSRRWRLVMESWAASQFSRVASVESGEFRTADCHGKVAGELVLDLSWMVSRQRIGILLELLVRGIRGRSGVRPRSCSEDA